MYILEDAASLLKVVSYVFLSLCLFSTIHIISTMLDESIFWSL